MVPNHQGPRGGYNNQHQQQHPQHQQQLYNNISSSTNPNTTSSSTNNNTTSTNPSNNPNTSNNNSNNISSSSSTQHKTSVNHVLLITVFNAHYPITCDIIQQVCISYGKVNRIVIFRKNGVQAMVEFDHVNAARQAKTALQGYEIYPGCCTLRVEYAKPARLNVHRNDHDSFDYTDMNFNSAPPVSASNAPGVSAISAASAAAASGATNTRGGVEHQTHNSNHNYHHNSSVDTSNHSYHHSSVDHHSNNNYHHSSVFMGHGSHQPQQHQHQHQQGTVMMVYGLCPNRLNCDRLFNLFCLYGNVARIKFLKSKSGCAMVQMSDYMAVERCMSSLNKVMLFGNELQISYSKQAFLHDVLQPYTLPDGSPSFKDFMGNKNNRFRSPEAASKNRILPPLPVLHFFNAPYGMTVEEMTQLFQKTSEHEPLSVKFFNPKNERSSSGLITFKDASESLEALILCNHIAIPRPPTTHPHILRLCFSPPGNKQPPRADGDRA